MRRKLDSKFASVDDYIASQAAPSQAVLERVRKAIRKAVPAAEESISYNIPTYKLGDAPVLYFAGWKKHYSLYPVSPELLASLKGKSEPFAVHKGTVHFPLDRAVPSALIAEIAKLRVQALKAAPSKTSKKASKTSLKKKPKKSSSKKAGARKLR